MRPPDHPTVPPPRIGVLLINLGTPDAPDVPAVRRYLREFLSDPRVIELPPLAWQPILNAFVLTTRPKRSAAAYAKVWMDDGSPLAVYTKRQAEALGDAWGDAVTVDWAMRYGARSIPERLAALKATGCDRILLAPLYPQYCAATTATANDHAFRALAEMRWQPAIRTLPPYYETGEYLFSLIVSIRRALDALDFAPDAILASFHGMPERTLRLGDPYHCQCQRTARDLAELMSRNVIVSFQSRFGRAQWLEPATADILATLPSQGVKRIFVIAPGFSADCLETLEELAIEGRDIFLNAGGERFAYIPCLNDSSEGVQMLKYVIGNELEGWLPAA